MISLDIETDISEKSRRNVTFYGVSLAAQCRQGMSEVRPKLTD